MDTLRKITFGLTLALLTAGLAACGGGDDPQFAAADPGDDDVSCVTFSDDPQDGCGTVYVALTDADGDFVSYLVDVVSISLTRADGAEVEVLPNAATVDFAQYVELVELVSAVQVPVGTYVSGSITVDYSDAQILVEEGGLPQDAIAVDDDGAPLTTLTLDLILDTARPLQLRLGVPALLELDFDLAASHTVDLDVTPIEVTAEPFIIADVDPLEERDFRLRGPLVRVSTADDAYRIALRPFHRRTGRHGGVTVQVDDATEYSIDGVPFTGDAGLAALALMPAATATVAQGSFDLATREFTAATVLAGSSVPGGDLDFAVGHVIARSGDSLTIMGRVLDRDDVAVHFRESLTVLVGDDTIVHQRGTAGDVGDDAISVGQAVGFLGELTDGDSTSALTLDASSGFAHMAVTRINGSVTAVTSGELSVDLVSFDGIPAGVFDFSGTGMDAGQDADPDAYQLDTGALDLSGLELAAPVGSAGHVVDFGMAAPDFEAMSVVDFSSARARLGADWTEAGTAAPFSVLETSGFALDLTNPDLGRHHHLVRGGVATDLSDLPSSPMVVPRDDRLGRYAIGMDGAVSVYSDFQDFVTELQLLLDGSNRVVALYAEGGFDADLNQLTAPKVAVRLESGS